MSVLFTAASSMALLVPSAARPVATIYPLTVGGWYRWATASGVVENGVAVGDTSGGALQTRKDAADAITISDEFSVNEATLTSLFSANIWTHLICRFITSTNRRYSGLRSDGTFATATAAGSKTFTGSVISLGCWVDGTSDGMSGSVAEFWWCESDIAVATENLTAAQHRQIAFGGPFSWPTIAANLKVYDSFYNNYGNRSPPNAIFARGKAPFLYTKSATVPNMGAHCPYVLPPEQPLQWRI